MTTASSLVTKVIAARDGDKKSYFLNDGFFCSFLGPFLDKVELYPQLLDRRQRARKLCDIWGPTCDNLDSIKRDFTFDELVEGDFLLWPNMGAYTTSCATNFNGFEKPSAYYIE